MKTVQDKDGNTIEVADNTLCHAGKNGALPIMLDAVLDATIFTETAAGAAAYAAGAVNRAKVKQITALKTYYDSDTVRQVVYGNGTVTSNLSAKNGTTELRARLRDNGDITTCEWYFDNETSQTLDVAGITALNKAIIDKDQHLRKMKSLHKAAINALSDESTLLAYDVTASINGSSWT